MIRSKLRQNILFTLDKHDRFESNMFKITSRDDGHRSSTLTISYIPELKYQIIFSVPTVAESDSEYDRPSYSFSGNACPGPMSYKESFSFKSENSIYSRITNWLDCIWEELSANPIMRQLDDQQKQIDDIFQKLDAIDEEYFTKSEANDLKARLDKLEETLKEQIEKEIIDKKELEKTIIKLHTDIDTLKQTVSSFNKKGWAKSFVSKIFKWSSNAENIKLLKGSYSLVRELLPVNIKDSLPE